MDPIEQLINEHIYIKSMLEVLSILIESKKENLSKSLNNLKIVMDFLSTYADELHHGKEEEVLFSELSEIEFFQNHQIINEIEDEHNQGRLLIKKIKTTLNEISLPLNEQIEDKLNELIWDYIDLLTQHIEKEDKILFPTILEHLDYQKLEIISKKFLQIEERIGKSSLEMQLQNLSNLKIQYK